MDEMLTDLYAHQAWADGMHWHAFAKLPAALEDQSVRERLHHMLLVQRAFLAIARGEPFKRSSLDDYASMESLKQDAQRYHEEAAAFLREVAPERLEQTVVVPWFEKPPCALPLRQALYQAAMHSHYHRAQNAVRLRELGAKPPTTDLIVWYWKGRPEPRWS